MRHTPVLVLCAILLAAGLAWWLLNDSSSTPNDTDTSVNRAGGNAEQAPELKGIGVRSTGADTTRGQVGEYVIAGIVVDENKKPLEGVAIELMRSGTKWPGQGYRASQAFNAMLVMNDASLLRRGKYSDAVLVAKTVSKEQGRFEFRVSDAVSYTVYARPELPRAGGSTQARLIAKARPRVDVSLTVFEGVELNGRVEDAQGQPVSASVYAFTKSRDWRSERPSDAASGTFAIAAVPKKNVSFVVTTATGKRFGGFKAEHPFVNPIVLKLPSGSGTLSGFVHTQDGIGIAKADIVLTLRWKADLSSSGHVVVVSKTDANGRIELSDLRAGDVTRVGVTADGYLARNLVHGHKNFEPVPVKEGEAATLDVTLSRGSTVHGVVARQSDKAPIEGALVTLYHRGRMPPQQIAATTNAEGRYTFGQLGEGKFLLLPSHPDYFVPELELAHAQGYNAGRRQPPGHLAMTLTHEEQRLERNLVLSRGTSLSGTVIDHVGKPVAGAHIHGNNTGLRGGAIHAWGLGMYVSEEPLTTSSSDGTFSLPGLAPRADWVLYARKERFAGVYTEPISLAEGPATGVQLTLANECVIRGRVMGPEGKPISGVNVFVGGRSMLLGGPYNFKSESDGTFELHSLPAADLQLSCRHKEESVTLPITGLKAGDVREGVLIQFGESVQVSGVVHDSQGKPVSGLSLYCRRIDGQITSHRPGYTNAQGEFTIKNLKPGQGQIYIGAGNSLNKQLGKPFEIPASDLKFVYDRPKSMILKGTIVDPEGTAIPLCRIAPMSRSGSRSPPREVNEGAFRVRVMGAPPYWLSVTNPRTLQGEALNLQNARVEIKDPTQPITITLKAGGVIRGRALNEQGSAVPGVSISGGSARATSDSKGAWKLTGLSKEPTVLNVRPPAAMFCPELIVAEPGTNEVIVKLLKASVIKGRIIVPEGSSIGGGNIVATWPQQHDVAAGRSRGTISAQGRFQVAGIPPEAVVSLEAQTHQSVPGAPLLPMAVVDGIKAGSTDVEIHLKKGVSASGILTRADGSPMAGIQVHFMSEGRFRIAGRSGLTDKRGQFEVKGLRTGPHNVTLYIDNKGHRVATDVSVPVANLKLTLPDSGTLSGRVADVPGDVSLFVEARDAESGRLGSSAPSGVQDDGSWTLQVRDKTRRWIVVARAVQGAGDQFARSKSVASGSTDIVLRLEQGLPIEGQVTSNGKAVPGVYLAIKSASWHASAGCDKEGKFKVRGLPPGTYTMTGTNWVAKVKGTREGVAAGTTAVIFDLREPLR